VLLDTFLVRTLLVPAIVVLCRRYNWWPSKLYRLELADDGRPAGPAGPVSAKPSPTARARPES
jgi:uncharacterized membrane protein YdfJ with MMPL/SSD domain